MGMPPLGGSVDSRPQMPQPPPSRGPSTLAIVLICVGAFVIVAGLGFGLLLYRVRAARDDAAIEVDEARAEAQHARQEAMRAQIDARKAALEVERARLQGPPPMNLPSPTSRPPALEARIIEVKAGDEPDETLLTIGRGTATGAKPEMRGAIPGVPGTFKVRCSERTCSADVFAPLDDVRRVGKVELR